MKTRILLISACSAVLAASPAMAQTVVRESTVTAVPATEVVGTVTEYSPDALVIRTQDSASPVRYVSSKTTEYVDETGARVSLELVKSGAPVTVHYVRDGDRMVASRVIVRRVTVPAAPAAAPETVVKKTTTTTTTTDQKKDKD